MTTDEARVHIKEQISHSEAAAAEGRAAMDALDDGPVDPGRKSYAWWHNNNPGQEVLDVAAKYADTDSPIRQLPFVNQGILYEWNDEHTELIWHWDRIPNAVEARMPLIIQAGGRLMLDEEAPYNVVDTDAVIDDMIQSQEMAAKVMMNLGIEKPLVGTYMNPHHHYGGAANLTASLSASTAGYIANHTRSGKRLKEFADLCHQVGGNVYDWSIYSWVFVDPPYGWEPPDNDQPYLFQSQGGGSWVAEAKLRERVQETLAFWNKPQIVLRGGEGHGARALEIMHEEILAWPS